MSMTMLLAVPFENPGLAAGEIRWQAGIGRFVQSQYIAQPALRELRQELLALGDAGGAGPQHERLVLLDQMQHLDPLGPALVAGRRIHRNLDYAQLGHFDQDRGHVQPAAVQMEQ